jgi:hypothetical protein
MGVKNHVFYTDMKSVEKVTQKVLEKSYVHESEELYF